MDKGKAGEKPKTSDILCFDNIRYLPGISLLLSLMSFEYSGQCHE